MLILLLPCKASAKYQIDFQMKSRYYFILNLQHWPRRRSIAMIECVVVADRLYEGLGLKPTRNIANRVMIGFVIDELLVYSRGLVVEAEGINIQ